MRYHFSCESRVVITFSAIVSFDLPLTVGIRDNRKDQQILQVTPSSLLLGVQGFESQSIYLTMSVSEMSVQKPSDSSAMEVPPAQCSQTCQSNHLRPDIDRRNCPLCATKLLKKNNLGIGQGLETCLKESCYWFWLTLLFFFIIFIHFPRDAFEVSPNGFPGLEAADYRAWVLSSVLFLRRVDFTF